MKNNEAVLKVFIMPQALVYPEWASLFGDKYKEALPFKWSFASDFNEAHVISWDGFITAKTRELIQTVLEGMKSKNQILLLQHVGQTLYLKHPFVEFVKTDDLKVVELPSGNLLPEDLLGGLDECHKKMHHV